MKKSSDKYRGSEKHKNRPSRGAKGTLCPEWTHSTPQGEYKNDPFQYDWAQTEAHKLFETAIGHPEGEDRRYATMNGIAFEAKPTNDGAWHGYPIPWQSVPTSILTGWLDQGVITTKQLKKQKKGLEKNIYWALENNS